ncbi:hypothetical protein L1887_06450 [Cichorium endivia]|nr:hypothetical protein L1887_06450 [Cichorium endivia]
MNAKNLPLESFLSATYTSATFPNLSNTFLTSPLFDFPGRPDTKNVVISVDCLRRYRTCCHSPSIAILIIQTKQYADLHLVKKTGAPEEAKLERNVRSISLCSGKTPLNVRPLDKTNRGFLKSDNLTTRCFQD